LLIVFTLMTEAISSIEMSVLTRTTRHHIPEGEILCSHGREKLKSYVIPNSVTNCAVGTNEQIAYAFRRFISRRIFLVAILQLQNYMEVIQKASYCCSSNSSSTGSGSFQYNSELP
jgi:hypothetical protein